MQRFLKFPMLHCCIQYSPVSVNEICITRAHMVTNNCNFFSFGHLVPLVIYMHTLVVFGSIYLHAHFGNISI